MLIRPARSADIPQLVGLLAELYQLEPDFPIAPALQAQGLALLLENPQCAVLVAVADPDSEILAMATLQPHISTGFGCKDAIFEDFVVKKGQHAQGIGSRLLQAVEQQAVNMGFQRMRLAADPDNHSALEFYKKRGWNLGRMVSCYRALQQNGNSPPYIHTI